MNLKEGERRWHPALFLQSTELYEIPIMDRYLLFQKRKKGLRIPRFFPDIPSFSRLSFPPPPPSFFVSFFLPQYTQYIFSSLPPLPCLTISSVFPQRRPTQCKPVRPTLFPAGKRGGGGLTHWIEREGGRVLLFLLYPFFLLLCLRQTSSIGKEEDEEEEEEEEGFVVCETSVVDHAFLMASAAVRRGGERRRRGNWKTGRRKERTKRRAFGIPPTQSSCRSSTVGGSFPRASFCSDRSSSLRRESSLASLPPSLPSAPSSPGGPGTFLNPLSLLPPPSSFRRWEKAALWSPFSLSASQKAKGGGGGSRDRRRKAVL